MIARRQFLRLAGAAAASAALPQLAAGATPQVTLKLHHFLPAVANAHTRLLVPWTKKIEAQSGGRIRIDIFPSMQLGGTAAQLYDQARDGVADIVCALPGYTPGRFPGIEVFELPFVASKRAVVNAQAVQDFYGTHLRAEFADVQPLCVFAHDGGVIHARRAIRTMADLKGLKLRAPTRLAGQALDALGADGIAMPVTQVPDALTHKAIDGCVVPWEVVPALKLQELVKYHSEIPGSPTLYTATYIVAMNKKKYAALPADLKKIIDANSGQNATTLAGTMWDEQAIVVEELVKSRGNTIAVLSAEETARWRKATEPVIAAWLKEVKAKGLDGEKLLKDARALIAKYAGA
jgi:TRAP-type C4-dicarboxylate transport system substrate-binding protein